MKKIDLFQRATGTSLAVFFAFFITFIFFSAFLFTKEGGSERPTRPNIILVVLDTVRKDFSGSGGSKTSFTPHLDKLSVEGTKFRNAWATAPWTVPSHASLFTGLLPSAHRCTMKNFRLGFEHRTLAEILETSGYETTGFFSNPWMSDRATGLLRGFSIRKETQIGGLNKMTRGRGDQGGISTNRYISEWLDKRSGEKPFFLFVNYLEAHLPYDPPADYRREFLKDSPADDLVSIDWSHEFNAGLHTAEKVDWSRVKRLYGADVYTSDRLLAELISALKKRGLYQDAVIFVTSDHGENLGDHGLMEHQFSVHETLLAVPLVVRAPGWIPKGVREDPVMLTDLFATILEIVGLGDAFQRPHSQSLIQKKKKNRSAKKTNERGRLLIAEYSGGHRSMMDKLLKLNRNLDLKQYQRVYKTVRQGALRLTRGDDGFLELHEIESDPQQAKNIAGERPRVVKKLSEALKMNLILPNPREENETQLDEETEKKLRSLGYIN